MDCADCVGRRAALRSAGSAAGSGLGGSCFVDAVVVVELGCVGVPARVDGSAHADVSVQVDSFALVYLAHLHGLTLDYMDRRPGRRRAAMGLLRAGDPANLHGPAPVLGLAPADEFPRDAIASLVAVFVRGLEVRTDDCAGSVLRVSKSANASAVMRGSGFLRLLG